jgi:hypothetical protein
MDAISMPGAPSGRRGIRASHEQPFGRTGVIEARPAGLIAAEHQENQITKEIR